MILATCSYMLGPVLSVLRRRGIPFANPYRTSRSDWNPLAPGSARRITAADRVLAFLRPDTGTWGEEYRAWTRDDFWRWASQLATRGLFKTGAKEWIDTHKGVEEPLDTLDFIDHVVPESLNDLDLIHFTNREDVKNALRWLLTHATGTTGKRLDYVAHVAAERGGAALREEPRLMVGTGHSVKGGEADTVYAFPDVSMAGAREWYSQGKDAVQRLLYVMMTRARENLFLCAPSTRWHVPIPCV